MLQEFNRSNSILIYFNQHKYIVPDRFVDDFGNLIDEDTELSWKAFCARYYYFKGTD